MLEFLKELAERVLLHLEEKQLTQEQFGAILGRRGSTVSTSIRSWQTMSGDFISRLAEHVPEFSDDYQRYLRLKGWREDSDAETKRRAASRAALSIAIDKLHEMAAALEEARRNL